jgi:hypothetical protein
LLLGWWKRELELKRAPENEAPTAGGGGGGAGLLARAAERRLADVGRVETTRSV